ncbi:DUF2877 domain-containing protein [Actinobacteria bacterium YIM 96077]|uniref:DUF2877 domain-containing protein n=1 Tax=Phytoactinopolyspora halophila TaxID=1981511 RepID=A0A329QLH3_9ACTN|nr:DUF2877 domain-containing protein [Phytoactinopolyspora halophila]AYY12953.1 DUF2877 domain-containing protein [Actinobacteria bacterium YIM 96077]RAW13217.1 hypothetical protein DPM12_12800 [Phytoactinopolyspora halophila]
MPASTAIGASKAVAPGASTAPGVAHSTRGTARRSLRAVPPRPAAVDRLLPAAASTGVRFLLRGPHRSGTVVASTRHMVAALIDGAEPELVCFGTRDAVRLPCSIVPSGALPSVAVGAPVSVGGGRVRLRDLVLTPTRWWPARSPAISDPRRCVTHAPPCPRSSLDSPVLAGAHLLAHALRGGDTPSTDDGTAGGEPAREHDGHDQSLDRAVDALLGLGPGLTPAGDDILAGALVTMRALEKATVARRDDPRRVTADQLASAVAAAHPHSRTSAVSAGLLAYAARGQCVPQFTALLTALDSPGGDIAAAHRRLLAVGHTSGAALYTGALCALDPLFPHRSS